MKTIQDLKKDLQNIHKKSYPTYKSLAGQYDFGLYTLSIDHVQGDPFAAPSHLTVKISHKNAGFPKEYYKNQVTATALCDYLLRKFANECTKFSHVAKGSGKSGVITVTRPGQEVLERSACTLDNEGIYVRFCVGFPANGRTINSLELSKILIDYIPKCIEKAFIFASYNSTNIQNAIYLAEDQEELRRYLKDNDYIAFVADGAILPRKSGVSSLPMTEAVPFTSPDDMRISIKLPHNGTITGMGIKKGITLIAGGGYHGKSTLLQALEKGVYNHIKNDGREFVITDKTALKVRAEDGRYINKTDISLFINNLPNNKTTTNFYTEDASGSTSQAANIIEGIESGSKIFLIDEDTSATNFMVRDELMQKIIAKEKEPITPFLERATDLYKKADISSIMVVGSCGSYFYIADTIIQMDNYHPVNITDDVTKIINRYSAPQTSAPDFKLPDFKRKISIGKSTHQRKNYRGTGKVTERLKVKTFGIDGFSLGNENVNLRYVEQLADGEQVETLALVTRLAIEHFANKEIEFNQIIDFIKNMLSEQSFKGISSSRYISGNLAMPRIQEIYCCLNRYRF